MKQSRRHFIKTMTTASAGIASLAPAIAYNTTLKPATLHLSCNSYSWLTFYNRAGKEWMSNPDVDLAEYTRSGLRGYEPGVTSVEEVQRLAPLLKKYKLEMRSIYVGTTLHDPATGQQSIDDALKIALAAKALGTRIVVTNPSPISWSNPVDKDDAALRIQARNLENLGSLLKEKEMKLVYHNHDMELRQGAREFHHMLSATDPRLVSFCLDVHWVYRGSGNSEVALHDVVRMYGHRIAELHIRQSNDHIWSEVFGKGDIDYIKLVSLLAQQKVKPHLVLEQCLEGKSPNTTDVVSAHREGLRYANEVFAPLAG